MPDLRYGTVSGFAAAAAEANRRRASSARATALAVAVVVTLGGSAGLTGRHGATDKIVPATPSPSASAAPSRLPRPVALPSARATVAAGPAAGVPSRGPDAVPGVSRPSPASRPSATVRPRQPWSTPIVRREDDAGFPCLDVNGGCFGTGAPVVTDDRVGLLARYCTGRDGEELSFADDAEVEIWVERQGSDVPYWRSLTDRPARPAAHVVPLGPSRCLEWKTGWFRRGDDGSAAPSGSYDVWFRVRSPQVTSGAQMASFYIP